MIDDLKFTLLASGSKLTYSVMSPGLIEGNAGRRFGSSDTYAFFDGINVLHFVCECEFLFCCVFLHEKKWSLYTSNILLHAHVNLALLLL